MPYGIVVSLEEKRLVQDVWPAPKEGEPTAIGRLVSFSPRKGRAILTKIAGFALGDTHEESARLRFMNRVTDLCGARLLDIKPKPVDTVKETVDTSEQLETDAEDYAPPTKENH